MQNQKQIKNRKLNRLKGYNYSQAGWYFLTICIKNREHFFGKIINGTVHLSTIGKTAQKCWQEIPTHFPNAKLDEFIIMPNHIHGIIVIENSNVGNKDFCSKITGNKITGNKTTGNKDFCSLQSWQTKWTRSLSSIVRGFKIGVTKWCHKNNINHGEQKFLFHTMRFSWQKSFYDHIIRNEKSLNKIREYIINNPLKWESDRNNSENLWM